MKYLFISFLVFLSFLIGNFIAKYTIVKKENKETNYWLRVIEDTNPAEVVKRMGDIRAEGLEILRVVSAIIINTKRKI